MDIVLVSLWLKYFGEWDSIFNDVKNKVMLTPDELNAGKRYIESDLSRRFITLFHDDYPEAFKNIENPPFVIWYHGDIGLLKSRKNFVVGLDSLELFNYFEKDSLFLLDEHSSKSVKLETTKNGLFITDFSIFKDFNDLVKSSLVFSESMLNSNEQRIEVASRLGLALCNRLILANINSYKNHENIISAFKDFNREILYFIDGKLKPLTNIH